MNFQECVSFQLNRESNFCKTVTQYFNEKNQNIETAVQLIIENTLSALNFQCNQNNKAEEIYKIAKGCFGVRLNNFFTTEHDHILSKGKGIIAEIFGMDLVGIIDAIAAKSLVPYHIINTLTALIAPVALATLNQINVQNSFTSGKMSAWLAGQPLKTPLAMMHYQPV
ncbi:MAG: DUF937 domain-containing protein [Niabella sp.]